jgi:bromodomain and WD repeat domain-containing protein 1/3
MYVPQDDEWPSCGRNVELDRILAGLERIMELSIAEYFNSPVDLDAYPHYAIIINYPIDLNMIKERVENQYYRRVNSIQWDVRQIEANARKFNEPKSEIVRNANFITELILEFIKLVCLLTDLCFFSPNKFFF